MKRSTDNILQELAREQAKLSELERSRDEVRARIASLRSELAAGLATTPLISPLPRIYRKRGWVSPMLLVNRRMGGVWKHEQNERTVAVEIEPFTKLPR